MTQLAKDFSQLSAVAQVAYDQQVTTLSAIRKELDRVDDQIAAIDRETGTRADQFAQSDGLDLAMRFGIDAKWGAQQRLKRANLLEEKARIAARYEVQFEATRAAFGKVEALKGLAKKASSKTRQVYPTS